MKLIETITKFCGLDQTHLRKIENNYGDVYYQVRCSGYDDGKKQVITCFDFNNLENAKEHFTKLTGVKL